MGYLVEDRLPQPQITPLWRGVIASHPSDIDDRINVRIPDMNKDLVLPNLRWMSRDNISLPQIGDDCLVAFDNDREPWVIAWWPFA